MAVVLDFTRSRTALPILCVMGGAVAMGISPIFMRWSELGPFATAFWRVALALPVLYLWMVFEAKSNGFPTIKTLFVPAVSLAGLAFAMDLFFWHLSVANTSIANATFFATCAPVWVIVFSWFYHRTPIVGTTLRGIFLCLLGGSLLTGACAALFLTVLVMVHLDALVPLKQAAPSTLLGDCEGLMAGVFFGLYFLAIKSARQSFGAAAVTFASSLITASILFIIALALEPKWVPSHAGGLIDVLLIALISHAAGQGLLTYALGRLPAVFSSLVIFMEALAAAAFGWLIIGEPVSLLQMLGGIFILRGIYIARPRE